MNRHVIRAVRATGTAALITIAIVVTGCGGPATRASVCDVFDQLGDQLVKPHPFSNNVIFRKAGDLGDEAASLKDPPAVQAEADGLRRIGDSNSTSSIELLDATTAIAKLCGHPLAVGMTTSAVSTPTTTTPPPPAGKGGDRAFVNALLPLHEKAVAIAIIGQTQGDAFVKDLSAQIVSNTPPQTAQLRAIGSALFSAGVPVGSLGVAPTTAADLDIGALRAAAPFDDAFLKAMIAIDEATIALCEAEIAQGTQAALRTTSQSIIDTDTAQLALMRPRVTSP